MTCLSLVYSLVSHDCTITAIDILLFVILRTYFWMLTMFQNCAKCLQNTFSSTSHTDLKEDVVSFYRERKWALNQSWSLSLPACLNSNLNSKANWLHWTKHPGHIPEYLKPVPLFYFSLMSLKEIKLINMDLDISLLFMVTIDYFSVFFFLVFHVKQKKILFHILRMI